LSIRDAKHTPPNGADDDSADRSTAVAGDATPRVDHQLTAFGLDRRVHQQQIPWLESESRPLQTNHPEAAALDDSRALLAPLVRTHPYPRSGRPDAPPARFFSSESDA